MLPLVGSEGFPFGTHYWRLFWLIPLEKTIGYKFNCEIRAEGFKTSRFDALRLQESPQDFYDIPRTRVEVNGEERELLVFEHTFILER